MNEEKDFSAFVSENEKAQQHALEIQQTRVGGLGGSDAALLLKIGESGLASLTATDHKRLAVMLGKSEPNTWSGNAYTNAGHAFEEYVEKTAPFGTGAFEREAYMSQPLARNFKTFAHADFLDDNQTVIECKYVQDDIKAVLKKYYAQLQWYFIMGARHVVLFHGTGDVEPFSVHECNTLAVERDENTIELMLAGISILDEAIEDGWMPDFVDKIALENTPEIVKRAFDVLAELKSQEEQIKERKNEATKVVKEYIEDFGLTGIVAGGEVKHQIVYTKESVSKTFDAAKFLKEHPEYNERSEYWKTTKRAASITFK